jgi:ribosomal protein L37E
VSRKRYRTKRRSCSACKPSKRGRAVRWTPKQHELLRLHEKALALGTWDE